MEPVPVVTLCQLVFARHSVRYPLPALPSHCLQPSLNPSHVTEAHDGDLGALFEVVTNQLLDSLVDPLPGVSVMLKDYYFSNLITLYLTSLPSRPKCLWPEHTSHQTPRPESDQG